MPDFQDSVGVLGTWWRFDRYELDRGVIRPAAGATLQPYDPWAAYTEARSGWGAATGKAPYESLLELVWNTRLRPTTRGEPLQLEPESERALLAWCTANGLLGLLPHEAEVAHLAPRWRPAKEFDEAGTPLVPTRLTYQRGYTGWQVDMDTWRQTRDQHQLETPRQGGEVVPRQLLPDHWGLPTVLRRAIGDASWLMVPIERAWGPFFPALPEQERRDHFYPVPLSDAFWLDYAEPLSTFLETATLFSETLQSLDAEIHSGDGDDGGHADHHRPEAHRALFSFRAGGTPALTDQRRDGSRTRAFHSKSLLATLAMMAYLDLTNGKRVLLCDEDGRPFVSGAYQARYCSERCRNRALKRAYRQRHRADDIPRLATGMSHD
jgi:hypothetical protein